MEIESLKTRETATKGDVRESELRLQKEIEILRKEIAKNYGGLQKEMAENRGNLQREIKMLEIKMLLVYGSGFFVLLGVLAKGFHWL